MGAVENPFMYAYKIKYIHTLIRTTDKINLPIYNTYPDSDRSSQFHTIFFVNKNVS
jgi:hypothetical protein